MNTYATVIHDEVIVLDQSNWQGKLYRVHERISKEKSKPANLALIPYYAWANRESGKMQAWIPWKYSEIEGR